MGEQLPAFDRRKALITNWHDPVYYRRALKPAAQPEAPASSLKSFGPDEAARLSAELALRSRVSLTLPNQIPELGPDNYLN